MLNSCRSEELELYWSRDKASFLTIVVFSQSVQYEELYKGRRDIIENNEP